MLGGLTVSAEAGQIVQITIPWSRLLRSSLVLPVVGLILGAVVGHLWLGHDAAVLALSAGGLFAGTLGCRRVTSDAFEVTVAS